MGGRNKFNPATSRKRFDRTAGKPGEATFKISGDLPEFTPEQIDNAGKDADVFIAASAAGRVCVMSLLAVREMEPILRGCLRFAMDQFEWNSPLSKQLCEQVLLTSALHKAAVNPRTAAELADFLVETVVPLLRHLQLRAAHVPDLDPKEEYAQHRVPGAEDPASRRVAEQRAAAGSGEEPGEAGSDPAAPGAEDGGAAGAGGDDAPAVEGG